MSDKQTTRDGCCAVGYGGPYEIADHSLARGYRRPHHIVWMPKGHGPTRDDYCICLVREPEDEDWGELGLNSPLIDAICRVIEDHMARPRHDRQAEIDAMAAKQQMERNGE